MQDRVSLYPGRVKLTPVSGQENTYDMVRADEPTQEGDPLSKATFLKDATAALFGLGTDAVPDDALYVLSRFHKGLGNEYVWEKTKEEWVVSQAESATSIQANTQNTKKLRYSDSYTLGSDGSITLNNPVEVTPTTSNYASVPLAGKYFQEANWSTGVYETAVYYSNQNLVLKSPYVYAYGYLLSTTLDVVSYGYLNSPDPNAYPPAVSDGYTYTALGQLGAKAQIATGSYMGTGTYGSANPNSLTFGFEPKLVIVWLAHQPSDNYGLRPSGSTSGSWEQSIMYTKGQCRCLVEYNNTAYVEEISVNGNIFSWYTTSSSAPGQLNQSGVTYEYFAIG